MKNSPDLNELYGENISRLRRLLKGNFSHVRTSLKKEMQQASLKKEYEKASELRDYISSLEFLLSSPVNPYEYLLNPNLLEDMTQISVNSLFQILKPYFPRLENLSRIESFDIAHLSGSFATAAMTVCDRGNVSPSLYRHFRIKYSQTNSDVSMMSEVLNRRIRRSDWPRPDLIVLDGGKAQLSIIKTLTVNPDDLPPIIALAKPFNTIVIPQKESFREINLSADNPGLLLLQNVCLEAHRFCRRLHHHYRAKIILT
jgi:excinuclease ABC subunit C